VDGSALVALAALCPHDMKSFYLAAKAPLAGEAKTRLGKSIGMNAAATLYSAFLRDLIDRFASAPFPTGWHLAPGARSHLTPFIGSSTRVRIQLGDSWAQRQANLFRDCAADGETHVVLAATDSPQLTPSRVAEAFAALDSNDAVFGPTHDGGYYLVGMRGFYDILEGVDMSTEQALDQVLAKAHDQQLKVALLHLEFDVDTADDLERLAIEAGRRDDLAHTAAALTVIRGLTQESRIA
jgi:uncharacterized protein